MPADSDWSLSGEPPPIEEHSKVLRDYPSLLALIRLYLGATIAASRI